jgi:hypothetical protein
MNENDEPRETAGNREMPAPESPTPSDSAPSQRDEVPFHVPRD